MTPLAVFLQSKLALTPTSRKEVAHILVVVLDLLTRMVITDFKPDREELTTGEWRVEEEGYWRKDDVT
jgi:hypothetical protein